MGKRTFLSLFLCLIGSVCQGMPDSLLMVHIAQMGGLLQAEDFDSVLVRVNELMPSAIENRNTVAQATLHNVAGSCLMRTGDRDGGMKAFMRSAAIVERNNILQTAISDKSGYLLSVFATMYGQMSLCCEEQGNMVESLHYARIGLRWLSHTNDGMLRATVMSCIMPALDANKEWRSSYDLLKQSFADASELGLYDFALMLADCLIRCEDEAFGRGPDTYDWIAKADALVSYAQTKEAKETYRKSRERIVAKYRTAKAGISHPKLQPQPSVHEELPIDTPAASHLDTITPTPPPPTSTPQPLPLSSVLLVSAILSILLAALFLWRRHSGKKRKKKSEQMMAEKYLEGQEDERNRLARELHDGVSNQLLAVEMKLSTDGLTTQTMQLLNESREQVRRVSHELIQPEFKHSTLDKVLADYAREMCGVHHSEVDYTVTPPDADWSIVPDTTALIIYRIVQEVVSNVLKHAGASLISIGLHQDEDGNIMVIVSDNGEEGQGSDVQGTGGIGLNTIRQRASSIGATLHFYRHQYGNVFKLVVKSS